MRRGADLSLRKSHRKVREHQRMHRRFRLRRRAPLRRVLPGLLPNALRLSVAFGRVRGRPGLPAGIGVQWALRLQEERYPGGLRLHLRRLPDSVMGPVLSMG